MLSMVIWMNDLVIENLEVSVEGKKIIKGINLTINKGEVVALMGPNGSGKSTLASALMGHPKYKIDSGKITLNGEDITNISPDKRAKLGLFLSFQYPSEIPGVSLANFLRTAFNARQKEKMPAYRFQELLNKSMEKLKMPKEFAKRYLNDGFSGGEKKRAEILQMSILNPEIAILDETDSGLDIDALRIVSDGINSLLNPELGVMIITHYQRILNYVHPSKVYIMYDGKIIMEGKKDLVEKLEEQGYDWIIEKYEKK